MTLLVSLLLGCPRPAPAPETLAPLEPEERLVLEEIWGPTRWEGVGIVVAVPSGWTGTLGPDGAPLRLSVERDDPPIVLEVWTFPATSNPGPRPREGCEPLFVDVSSYRGVPALAGGTVATCIYNGPTGEVVEGWYAVVDGREVHVEVRYLASRVFEGRAIVAPILHGIERVH